MKPVTKIQFLDDSGEKFFGEGPCRLLRAVEETGSLRCAAASMEMAYSKALKLVKQAETTLGFPLTQRSVGGKDGGGSTLTPEGRAWLVKYEAYRDACIQENRKLYAQFFPEQAVGCVIMASGLGKRFGDNKLMADFRGPPMDSLPGGWWSPGTQRWLHSAGNGGWRLCCTTCPTAATPCVWGWKRWAMWRAACSAPEISPFSGRKLWRRWFRPGGTRLTPSGARNLKISPARRCSFPDGHLANCAPCRREKAAAMWQKNIPNGCVRCPSGINMS